MTIQRYHLKIIFLIMTIQNSYAEPMSPKSLFYRCYSQITQSYLPPNHPLLSQVQSGNLNPINACLQVLSKANFTTNNNSRISNTSDLEARSVLNTFQRLHYSWFSQRNIVTPDQNRGERDTHDVGAPAAFYTKAFFDINMKFSDIFSGKNNYETLRINSLNLAPFTMLPAENFGFSVPNLSSSGDLVGVTNTGERCVSWIGGNGTNGSGCWGKSLGGGVLGSQPYIMLNLAENTTYRSNGGLNMGRNWGEKVYKDFFCRSLPVVRETEVINRNDAFGKPLVEPSSEISFRNSPSCVSCHASMDRLSNFIRSAHFSHRSPGDDERTGRVGYWIHHGIVDRAAETRWPISNDRDFWRRPASGDVFYTGHDGRLVNRHFTSLEAAGQFIATQDEVYVCAAKRYFEYFTGIDVEIGDIANPSYPKSLSSTEMNLRNDIIQMARSMKQHQNPQTLIREILNHPVYSRSNLNINK
jgi:hypothetical protein